MSIWRERLINAYTLLSWPYRQQRLKTLKETGQVPVAILFYHRVDDQYPNDWTISKSGFKSQIDWFQKNFDLVDLAECQRRIRSNSNQRPTLSITFDDGYADNCSFALPMLLRRKIPVTYFVTTYHTTQSAPFKHDVENGRPLATNSIESLRALSRAGIEIGGHTRSHADLAQVNDADQLFDEVIASTEEMEALIGQKIRYFAFPFGQPENLNPRAFSLLKQHGFAGVCSAYGGLNLIGDDEFHLQRIHGDPMFSRMKNWLTYDPRLLGIKRYDYEAELAEVDFDSNESPSHQELSR